MVIGRAYDINDVYSCKSNGVGYAQACSFISDLNLPQPTTSCAYYTKLDKLATACTKALEEYFRIIRIIVKEEHLKLEKRRTDVDVDTVDIAVSYDGTWQKRGHTSRNGVFVAIDVLTGYVVDFEVMSNYCQVCEKRPKKDDSEYNEFWRKHQDACKKNHDSSSNAMERRSKDHLAEIYNTTGPLRYTVFLGDGDSLAYDAVCSLNVYGDVSVKKEECIKHVAKRLRTHLKNLKVSYKKTLTPISGKGKLTDTLMRDLQSYYRNAITQNSAGIDGMKKAISAAPYHITYDYLHPQHDYCPRDSWCWYKNPSRLPSKPDLPIAMLSMILIVYERFSDERLLARCANVSTQNANECLNGEIW